MHYPETSYFGLSLRGYMTTMWRGVIIIPTLFRFVAHEKGLITIINVRSASLPPSPDRFSSGFS